MRADHRVNRIAGWMVGRLTLAALGLAVLHPGCGDQSGVPQPEPLAFKLRNAPLAKTSPPRELLLVGLPGAVAGVGEITVEAPQGTRSTRSTAAGSFALLVFAGPNESLGVRFDGSGATPYRVAAFSCPVSGCAPPTPPGPRAGLTPISAPLAGKTTIQGEVVTLSDVVAVNLRLGAVATATPKVDSSFRVELEATSGDKVEVFSEGSPLGASWQLSVP